MAKMRDTEKLQDGVEQQKLLAEIRRINADADRAIAETSQLTKKWWEKPAWWAAIVPGTAALATIAYAYLNFNSQVAKDRRELEILNTENKKLVQDAKELNSEAELKLQSFELLKRKQQLTEETDKLAADKITLDKSIDDLNSEKAEQEKELASMSLELQKLNNERDAIPVQNAIEAIISDERNFSLSFKDVYVIIAHTLRKTRRNDIRKLVIDASRRASHPNVKALLLRSSYLGLRTKEDFDAFIQVALDNKNPDQFFWQIYGGFDSRAIWSDSELRKLSAMLAKRIKWYHENNRKFDLELLRAHSSNAELLPNVSPISQDERDVDTLTRNALNSEVDAVYDSSLIQFISFRKPYASQLLFSDLLRSSQGQRREDLLEFGGMQRSSILHSGLKNLFPASNSFDDWMSWQNKHKADLKIVLEQPSEKWPDGQ